MFSRPGFLNRLFGRLPNVRGLRLRLVWGGGFMATLFGACLVLAAVGLDARRSQEVARERAETLAVAAGHWLDGDAHAGLGSDPAKRLDDLKATLAKVLEAGDLPCEVQTLRPRPEVRATLGGDRAAVRAGALEVVLDASGKAARKDQDYRPEMAPALFDGEVTSVVSGSEVRAYAPVLDSWGATTAVVCVRAPSTAPLWRQIVFWSASVLFAGLLVSLAVLLARRTADALELHLATLESGVRQLASGRATSPFALARSAPSELARLAEALEDLRARFEGQASGLPAPLAPTAPDMPAAAALGEASDFDLALLLQQLVDSAKKIAQVRGLELQLVFPDGVPSRLVGHAMPLYRTLEALMRHALQTTQRGRITLRVHRASDGGPGERLRFEVADTGPGIPFKDQPALAAALAEAVQHPPDALQDPLQLASALAAALGGELSFESQPGQGSRFGFTAGLQSNAPPPATGFHPAPGGIPPESAFVPRRVALR